MALLTFAVFVAGMATLGIELTASRLLGKVFGTSNIVWANIIGLILVYLTAGYFLGGRLADRSPTARSFYRLLAWASSTAGLVPIVARPVLLRAATAVERLDAALMVGSFLSVLILFSVPVTLLGCVSPFAIRLTIRDTTEAGRVSGRLYAISTLGSIIGTFLPILWLIPAIGTARTFIAFSLGLMAVALVGLARSDGWRAARFLWMPIALIALAWLVLSGPIKPTSGILEERESAYNYIQVLERDGVRYLFLNEGQGVHSVYAPGMEATFGTWDYFLAAPFFNPAPVELGQVTRLGLVGLAGGTIARQYTTVFGPIPIDGWEIDPQIIDVGRTYFGMDLPNLTAIAQDGRWGLAHSQNEYSVIGVDAYRLPYVPWHLTTREFFQEVRERLAPDGVLAINVGRTPTDRRLIEALGGTLASVFPTIYVVDVPDTFNSILYATVQATRQENLVANLIALQGSEAPKLLLDVLERTIVNLRPPPESGIVFTDDWAPIEGLTNSIAIRFLFEGDLAILR